MELRLKAESRAERTEIGGRKLQSQTAVVGLSILAWLWPLLAEHGEGIARFVEADAETHEAREISGRRNPLDMSSKNDGRIPEPSFRP
jgi:hypothetical protein